MCTKLRLDTESRHVNDQGDENDMVFCTQNTRDPLQTKSQDGDHMSVKTGGVRQNGSKRNKRPTNIVGLYLIKKDHEKVENFYPY